MTELEKMERARTYLDKLANGIDPLTDKELPNDTILNNVRLARCFFFASDVLRRVIENGGEIKASRKPKRNEFALTAEQRALFHISKTPLRISDIVEKLNAVIDTESMKKISTTTITSWLLTKGFLQEVVNDAGKKSRLPTELGNSIGLFTEERKTVQGRFTVVLYNMTAQEFILDHLDAITESEVATLDQNI